MEPWGNGIRRGLYLSRDGRHVLLAGTFLVAMDIDSGRPAWLVGANTSVTQVHDLGDGRIVWGNRIVRDGTVVGKLPFLRIGPICRWGSGAHR